MPNPLFLDVSGTEIPFPPQKVEAIAHDIQAVLELQLSAIRKTLDDHGEGWLFQASGTCGSWFSNEMVETIETDLAVLMVLGDIIEFG